MKKKIAILGSTGSIGTQALEVIEAQTSMLEVEVLTANSNSSLLVEQALKFKPNHVVIADPNKYSEVNDALWGHDIKVYAGATAIEELMGTTSADIVLTAMVGYSGLKPTIAAIKNKKKIALANKETLVVAGELISSLCQEYGVSLIPVDSEHSAIFQCLVGEHLNPVENIILTASGGPFRGKKYDELKGVTKAQALKHPNWTMGAKITIDSATLMNKGLEVIEAKWLFDLQPNQIEVLVHPQSIIHSMVTFADGSIKAQLGLPDMKLPIHYAFFYPNRVKTSFPRMDFGKYPTLTFEKPDLETFSNLSLAFEAMNKGGNAACILNAANEIAVAAFLNDEIKFLEIAELNKSCLAEGRFIAKPSLDDYVDTDRETRELARRLLG